MSRQASYGISKATVNALTVKLTAEMEATGILVNALCPGEHAWRDAMTVRGEGLKGLLATVGREGRVARMRCGSSRYGWHPLLNPCETFKILVLCHIRE